MRRKILIIALASLVVLGLACGKAPAQSSVGTIVTPIEDIGNFLGEQVTTCGQVIEARYHLFQQGRPTYLYINDKFPFQELSVVVMERDRDKFPQKLEEHYNGEYICVAGEIQGYSDQPEMLIQSPTQIEIREATNTARLR